MVLTKRFGYGFDGYQVPTTPQGSRQFRKKRSVRKRVQGDPMCSFELLATVAGRVLLEKETECSKNSVKEEQQDELKFHKAESRNQGDCCTRTDVHENGFQRIIMASRSKECLHSSATVGIHPRSIVIKSDPSKKVGSAEKPKFNRSTTKFVKSPSPDQEKISCKEQGKVANGVSTLLQLEPKRTTNGNRGVVGMQLQEDPMEVDAMPALLRSVEAPVHADSISRASSSPKCETDKEFSVGSRNDGKSPRINNPYNSTSKYLRGQHIGDRRIRKFMGTKLLKVGPTYKNEREFHNLDEDVKSVLYSRKICYMRRRTQRSICKRRKLFERGTVMTSDAPINYEDICPSPQMNITKEKASSSLPRACEGGGTSTSSADQRISFQSEDYPVKFSIKSFKVPELVIEIPETATVGSLRRTVMEAVSAIIGGGLRVGVVLQGKKVRDDNKTLLQAGISKSVELDGLGFTLEPNPLEATQQQATKTEDGPFLSSCDAPELLKRFPANPSIDPAIGETEIPNRPPPPTMSASGVEGEQQADHSPPASTAPMANNTPSSKALVAHPATNAEALAIVPRTTRSNAAQRRIRRPFSVPEVEALVQAVEKLGTGRWRDVKLRSFDDANHRTYVDLKDKWKTLVHTARISPQRRRGEPVPQELLERVLSAHAYWTQQQVESQQLEPWLLLDGGSPRLAPSPPYLSDETR